MKIYLVMEYNSPYAIFDNIDSAIEMCVTYIEKYKTPPSTFSIYEYEMNGKQTIPTYVWSSWWYGRGE